MKKLISCLFVVASLTSVASTINWEMSELLARRDLEIYAALEKMETDPVRKEALQTQIAKAKDRIDGSIAAARREKDKQDKAQKDFAFQAFGSSAVASIAGLVVKIVSGSRIPGPSVVAPAALGLLVTLGCTAADIVRQSSLEGVDAVFKSGIMGMALGTFPAIAVGRF